MMAVEIETLLNQRLGLDAESIGSSAIARAVRERMSACQSPDGRAYWEHLITSETEMRQLIELVVVPETWFFRDAEAFATLAGFALKEWLPAHPESVLRLLSLPCSTGEEPYSMAMALLDADIPARRFSIDGVDISERALGIARNAVYGKNSFRSRDLSFRDRYFKAVKNGHGLTEPVCRQVHFQTGNLIESGLLPGQETYDVIFCRNLLIYFDSATQERAVRVLRRLLRPEGLLFVGPSETAVIASQNFVSLKIPLAFAFRKNSEPVRPGKKTTAQRNVPPVAHPLPPIRRPTQRVAPNHPPQPPIAINIDEALQFADQGRMDDAENRCNEFVQAHGPSAKAFYVLGLLRDAVGKTEEAIPLYRKALYLDPHHHEALLQLALLLDKQGDKAGAKVLSDRANRIEQKGRR